MGDIKLIVGLSNPGVQYALTRHNAGAWYVKLLAKYHNQSFKKENKFFGYTAKINLADKDVILLIPTTYMNFSGKSVLALIKYYEIKPTEILIAHDELDLMPGIAKIKLSKGNNGHNGLKDIQKKIGNNHSFYRLRIGIGHPGNKNKVVNFVLSNPTIIEQKLIYDIINEAIYCTSIIFNEGFNKAIKRLHTFKAIKR